MVSPSIVVFGNFDGVHLGHKALLREAAKQRDSLGLPVTVWSFEVLPGECLTPTALRKELLLSEGADAVVFDRFARVREYSPHRFFEEIVLGTLDARAVICGFNYSFGYGGKGNAETMAALCREADIACHIVPEVTADGETVSSTRIRALLKEGRVEEAARLLGRPPLFTAPVEGGRHFGRQNGVPTLNQSVPQNLCLPKNGVYATFCLLDGKAFPAVTNVGVCPTVTDGSRLTVETHILHFDGSLYDQTVTIGFLAFLRNEKAFPSSDALYDEIRRNVKEAEKVFEERLDSGELWGTAPNPPRKLLERRLR